VIELMLVVTIVAIGTLMAAISYQATLPNSRLRQATTELYSAIALAKVSAMSQNSTMTVLLTGASSASSGGNVTVTGTASVPVRINIISSTGTSVMSQPLTNEVVQVDVAPGAGLPLLPRVQFNSYGLHVGGNTQLITLMNTKGKIYSISVAPSGKAKWCLAAVC
jgi:Tfp pilus assembly protein FimT